MGTWNAFYVRTSPGNAEVSADITKRYLTSKMEFSPTYLGARLPDQEFEAPEEWLKELSQKFNADVIWLGFQSNVDAFQFHHWLNGEHLRSLVYGCFGEERTWDRAEGKPEAWESDILFHPRTLQFALEYAEDDAARDALKRIWQTQEILPGQVEPGLESKSTAFAVATHYQLPHYGIKFDS